MTDICATTLPQMALTAIESDSKYHAYLGWNNKRYNRRAELFYSTLSPITGITCAVTQWRIVCNGRI